MRMPSRHFPSKPALARGLSWLLFASLLSACASKNPLMEEPAAAADTGVQTIKQPRLFGFLSPYRPDIQQGNFVSEEMVSQLKIGMTPDQVRFVLGTPLLNDIFHAERWDYPFRMLKGNGELTTSRVTVFFEDNRVARIEGGDLPAEKEYLARLLGDAPPPKTRSTPPESPAKLPPSTANEPQ